MTTSHICPREAGAGISQSATRMVAALPVAVHARPRVPAACLGGGGWRGVFAGRFGRRRQPQGPEATLRAAELCSVLRAVIEVLDADGEAHWREWMAKGLGKVEAGDLRGGARHVLGAYGGMGSFNDLVIGQRMEEGVFTWAEGYQTQNDRLDGLRADAYDLAQALEELPIE